MPLRNIFADACPCYGGCTYESKKNLFIAKKLFVPFGGVDLKPGHGRFSGPTPCQPAGNLAIRANICRCEAVNWRRTGQPGLPILTIPAIY